MLTWQHVALAAINMLQLVLLAFLAGRRLRADEREKVRNGDGPTHHQPD